jgi:integrase
MASIQATKSGGFRVFYIRGGKRCASPVQVTREAAEAWIREHCAALAARTVIEVARAWEAEAPSPHRSEAAFRICEAARRRGWGAIESLGAAELSTWQREASPRYGQYLRTLLRWAARQHRLPVRADALDWRPGKYPRRPPIPLLTDAQAKAIRGCARRYGGGTAALIDYLLTYGARPITACQLRRRHLDASRGELIIEHAKHSGGWRHAVRDDHVAAWLKLGKDLDGPLFPHPQPGEDGKPRAWKVERGSARELCNWYKSTIAKRLKLGAQAGIYNLKRYAITKLLRSGVDPATVALFTGHLDLEQVLTYAKSNADLQRQALALLSGNTRRNTVTRLQGEIPQNPR